MSGEPDEDSYPELGLPGWIHVMEMAAYGGKIHFLDSPEYD
jgi:hypothetical protein